MHVQPWLRPFAECPLLIHSTTFVAKGLSSTGQYQGDMQEKGLR